MKPSLILASCLSLSCAAIFSSLRGQETNQNPPASSADDFSRRLQTAIEARKSGDPTVIGQASQKVIALGLQQMAKFRLDEKAYDEAVKLCRESLEFEDTPGMRVELAIASFYAKRPAEAEEEASLAAEKDPQNPLAWTLKGEALLQNKDYTGAATALERAIAVKPDAESLYALGIAHLGLGEKQKASDCFSQMLQLVGDSGWSRILVGRAYAEQDFIQDAVAEFQSALRIEPNAPNAHYFWALTLLQANEWAPTDEVRSHLQEELKLYPRQFLANYLLGFFASSDRNYAESDRYLQIAAGINPSLPEVWMYLGLNANARNNTRAAEAFFRKAIALGEREELKQHLSIRKAYIALGRILLSSGRKKEGEELLGKARKMQLEEMAQRQQFLAGLKSKEGAHVSGAVLPDLPQTDNRNALFLSPGPSPSNEQALQAGGRIRSPSPQDPTGNAEKQLRAILGSSFNDLATAEALQEKYDLAFKHYHEAADWDSRIPGLQRNLGLAAYFAGQPAEAIRLLSKVVRETPGDEHARAVLGLSYFAAGDFAKTTQTIAPIANRAIQDPQLGLAWAKSLSQTGNKRAAIRALQRLEESGTNLSAQDLIQFGKLWQELGDAERANQSFRRALALDPENTEAKCALHLSECP